METNRNSALRNVVNAEVGGEAAHESGSFAIDLAFLQSQTFGDALLEREVLGLFVEQAKRVVTALPAMGEREQREAAHLLKGSSRGIGAWAAAAIAEAYEQAAPAERLGLYADLAATFAEVEAAIGVRLGRPR